MIAWRSLTTLVFKTNFLVEKLYFVPFLKDTIWEAYLDTVDWVFLFFIWLPLFFSPVFVVTGEDEWRINEFGETARADDFRRFSAAIFNPISTAATFLALSRLGRGSTLWFTAKFRTLILGHHAESPSPPLSRPAFDPLKWLNILVPYIEYIECCIIHISTPVPVFWNSTCESYAHNLRQTPVFCIISAFDTFCIVFCIIYFV